MTVVEAGARPEGGADGWSGAGEGGGAGDGDRAGEGSRAGDGGRAGEGGRARDGARAGEGGGARDGGSERTRTRVLQIARLGSRFGRRLFSRISGRVMAGRECDATRLARFSAHLGRERENERNQTGPM